VDSVKLKDVKGKLRNIHITPVGRVMAFSVPAMVCGPAFRPRTPCLGTHVMTSVVLSHL
jgi:hypothetical protein